MADTKLVLKRSVQAGEGLHLAQVAAIKSDDPKVTAYLGSLAIPSVYTADGVLTKGEIAEILRNSLIDPKRIRFVGERVSILSNEPITKERLENLVRGYIKSHYKDVRIKRIAIDSSKPLQGYRIHIEPSSESFSHIYLKIVLTSDNKRLLKRASVVVERYAKLPVAARDIPRGSIITPDSVTFEKRRLTNSAQKRELPATVIGSVARTSIKAGSVIKPFMVTPDYAVKKRKNVKIIYQKGAIRIELLGLALDNGNIGDTVRIKNLSSNKVLRCKVLQNGVVQYR